MVYAATARDVRTTIIQGKVIMEDRRINTIDVNEVRQHMGALARKISASVAQGIN